MITYTLINEYGECATFEITILNEKRKVLFKKVNPDFEISLDEDHQILRKQKPYEVYWSAPIVYVAIPATPSYSNKVRKAPLVIRKTSNTFQLLDKYEILNKPAGIVSWIKGYYGRFSKDDEAKDFNVPVAVGFYE